MYSPDDEHYKELSAILNKALQKEPQQRTQSVQKLCKELSALYCKFPHIGSKWFVDVTRINKKNSTQQMTFLSDVRTLSYTIAFIIMLIIGMVGIGISMEDNANLVQTSENKVEEPSAEIYFEKSLDSYYFQNNYSDAWKYSEKALANSVDPRYLMHKAKMLFLGHGVEKNVAKAHTIAQQQLFKLKTNHDGFSLYMVGYAYSIGMGGKKSQQLAVNWYNKAAAKNHPVALNNLAVYYNAQRKYVDAFLLLQKSAELNLPTAQTNLAMRYLNGSGVVRNYEKAVSLFRKAAENGHAQAIEQIGVCYYNGFGVNKNYVSAAQWFRKAALKDRPVAIYCLGYCYEHGHGVKRSISEAVYWYQKASNLNYQPAKKRLAALRR